MTNVYFDFSATFDGTGTSPSQAASAGAVGAFNTIEGRSPASGAIWWIRRTATIDPMTGTLTIATPCFSIVGWPKATDGFYTERPAAGISEGWDSDADDYGILVSSSSSAMFSITASNVCFSRIQYHHAHGNYHAITMSSSSSYGCSFANLYFDGDKGQNYNHWALKVKGYNHVVSNCIFQGTSDYASSGGILYLDQYTEQCLLDGIQMFTGVLNDANDCGCIYCYNIANYNVFTNFTIVVDVGFSSPSEGFILKDEGQYNTFKKFSINTNGDYPQLWLGSYGNLTEFTFLSTTLGMVSCGAYAYMELPAFTCSQAYSAYSYAAANFKGNSGTMILEGVTNIAADGHGVSLGNNSQENVIVCKNAIGVSVDSDEGTARTGVLYSLNDGGTAGYWKGLTPNGVMESSSIVRTGGGDFSIYCEKTNDTNCRKFPWLGEADRAELLWLDLGVGTHSIEFYGAASSLFTIPIGQTSFLIESEYKDADGITLPITNVNSSNRFADDATSVWSEAGLNGFKIGIEITLAVAQVVPIRISGSYPYEANTYLYLDMDPDVASV